jgi:FtsZ-interacting cell division protein ZipA
MVATLICVTEHGLRRERREEKRREEKRREEKRREEHESTDTQTITNEGAHVYAHTHTHTHTHTHIPDPDHPHACDTRTTETYLVAVLAKVLVGIVADTDEHEERGEAESPVVDEREHLEQAGELDRLLILHEPLQHLDEHHVAHHGAHRHLLDGQREVTGDEAEIIRNAEVVVPRVGEELSHDKRGFG